MWRGGLSEKRVFLYKGTANYNLLGAYVAKMIGYSAIDFFEK